jgi:hypothetical protein
VPQLFDRKIEFQHISRPAGIQPNFQRSQQATLNPSDGNQVQIGISLRLCI